MRLGIEHGVPFPEPPNSFEDYASRLEKSLEEAHELARECLHRHHERAQERYDKKLFENLYKIGDRLRVLQQTKVQGFPTKFSPHWCELHVVQEINGPVIKVKSLTTNQVQQVNHDELRKSTLDPAPHQSRKVRAIAVLGVHLTRR